MAEPRHTFLFLHVYLSFIYDPCLANIPLRWSIAPSQDPCYNEQGHPKFCIPEFINAAFGRSVEIQGGGDQDHVFPENTTVLTDLNNPHNLTCWHQKTEHDQSLTVSLGRRFELTYISLQFCFGQTQEDTFWSTSILKSMDFGRTWKPYQFYSPQCQEQFGRPSHMVVSSRAHENEALCSDPRPLQQHRGGLVLAFSTLDGRLSAPDYEYSPILQDWATATDIRKTTSQREAMKFESSDMLLKEVQRGPAILALSDLQVGGRCKCNGHASRCIRDPQGQAICECRHNTAGVDCDMCKPFYYDRPWQRATPEQPHECVACQCNLHSSRCRFNMELYQLSGRKSGGVCLNCHHNTAGRHCHYCKDGFARDLSKPTTHRKTCRPCSCHPVGAIGKSCNQTSGQCRCRDGVTGLTCNRCAPGFQQSRSPIRPCVSKSDECYSYCQPSQGKVRMNLKTYCQTDYVLKAQVQVMERSGPWWRFSVSVQQVFRRGTQQVRKGIQSIWVPEHDLSCGCPALQVGKTFLIIGSQVGPDKKRIIADHTSVALPWRDHWNPKLRVFRTQDRRGINFKAEDLHFLMKICLNCLI
uniref:Netrin 5 n=1 Tax=Erpetoichthys calabaricus TaxID=27687 RepID=A0A8C4X5F4_ERPCA